MIVNLCFAVLPVVLISVVMKWMIKDGEKEYPWTSVGTFMAAGGIAAIASYYLEAWVHRSVSMGVNWYWLLIEAFIITALVEEVLKLASGFSLYSWLRRQPVIFCILSFVFLGLGFSLVENVIYAMGFDWITMALRSFTALPSHAIYGVVMGTLTAKAIHAKGKKVLYWALALIIPTLIHGLYDWFVIQDYADWLILGAPLVLIITGWFSYLIIRWNKNKKSIT